ncbi:hypothetical protein AAMO2058_000420400 [Amorphochlora amoebiformis]|eukprot:1395562-Amorphochlora_amoeboformis.AAC.1
MVITSGRTASAERKTGGGETNSERLVQEASEVKIGRTISALKQMLQCFTVTREMMVELSVIIEREYQTSDDRVRAVQQKLSQWKQDGLLRLRAPYRRRHAENGRAEMTRRLGHAPRPGASRPGGRGVGPSRRIR